MLTPLKPESPPDPNQHIISSSHRVRHRNEALLLIEGTTIGWSIAHRMLLPRHTDIDQLRLVRWWLG